ncbi:MAG: aminoacetone oxidase family FAD-binding enzyme [Clostridiales Family XIII bacterium]|jgi:predicted Rossmann fold flavoprotein|nr:aminoacetone oxidase family FAD-binding enzyme [Clostridiales Family XIII bacterium]
MPQKIFIPKTKYRAMIIGGGASGLCAAVSYLAAGGKELLLIEALDELGKKILATGNGRCNLTNVHADGYADTIALFSSLGVPLRADAEGRAYPMSNRAASVRDAFVERLKTAVRAGLCEVLAGRRVSGIVREASAISVSFENGASLEAEKVLIATGGKAGPQYGSFGDGFAFARSLGQELSRIRPSLVQLVYSEGEKAKFTSLDGARAKANAKLTVSRETAATASGEILFRKDCLSGIMAFDLSCAWPMPGDEGEVAVVIDLAPALSEGELVHTLKNSGALGLRGVLDERIAAFIECEAKGDDRAAAAIVKAFEVPVSGTKGWREAQVTKGGVALPGIREDTGESVRIPGLYFAGEVLNRDFVCGGYNLDHAWNSGRRAGIAMAK